MQIIKFARSHWQLISMGLVILASYAVFMLAPIDWEEVFQGQSLYYVISFAVFAKVVSYVFPPFPGGLVVSALVPFIGWKLAVSIEFFGNFTGVFITYYLGRKYGEQVLRAFKEDSLYEFLERNMAKEMGWQKFLALLIVVVVSADMAGFIYGTGKLNMRELIVILIIGSVFLILPSYFLIDGLLHLG